MANMVWLGNHIYITSIMMYEGPTLITIEQHPFIRQYGAQNCYESLCNEMLSQGYSIYEQVEYKRGGKKTPKILPYTIFKRTPTAPDYIKVWWVACWE